MFRRQFCGDPHRLSGIQRHLDLLKGDPFGMQVHFNATPAIGHTLKNRFPKAAGAIWDTALGMSAESDSVDGRAGLEKRAERIAAVLRMVGVCQAVNHVVDIRTIEAFVRVPPEAQLKMQPASRRFVADEL